MVPVLKLVAASIDVSVLCLVVTLLVNHHKSQHDWRSWATAFHVLVMIWLSLRGMFWIGTITTSGHWHSATFYLLYWLPNPLQFGSFLLLPLFYGQMICSTRAWEMQSRVIAVAYISVVFGMVMFMVVWTVLEAIQERKQFQCISALPEDDAPETECYRMEFSSEALRWTSSLCFFALAVVVGAFGMQVSKLPRPQQRKFLIYQPRALGAMNCVLCTVFLSKGLYQMLSVLKLWYLPNLPLEGGEDICLLNFCVFVCWDYMPTVLLLLMLVRAPGKINVNPALTVKKVILPNPRTTVGDPKSLLDYGLFLEIKKHAEAEALALAQSSQSSRESDPAPSPVLVNTWLRDDSSTFSYSPSTAHGSYSSTPGGVGYGNIHSFNSSNAGSSVDAGGDWVLNGAGNSSGFTPSPASGPLVGEQFVSPSAASSGEHNNQSRQGSGGRLFGRSFWGGRRARSDSGIDNGSGSDHGWSSLWGGRSRGAKSDAGIKDGGDGDGWGADGSFNAKSFKSGDYSTRSVSKSDPGILARTGGSSDADVGASASVSADGDLYRQNDKNAAANELTANAQGNPGFNLWKWWRKVTGGDKAPPGRLPAETGKTYSLYESTRLLRQNRGPDEAPPGGGEYRNGEVYCYGGSAYGGLSYGGYEEYPLRQDGYNGVGEGDKSAGDGDQQLYGWRRQQQPLQQWEQEQGGRTCDAVAWEGGGYRWQSQDVEDMTRPAAGGYAYEESVDHGIPAWQQQQQHCYEQQQSHLQHQHPHHQHQQAMYDNHQYQRGLAGGVAPPGTIIRQTLVSPLKVPMPVDSPDGGQRKKRGHRDSQHAQMGGDDYFSWQQVGAAARPAREKRDKW